MRRMTSHDFNTPRHYFNRRRCRAAVGDCGLLAVASARQLNTPRCKQLLYTHGYVYIYAGRTQAPPCSRSMYTFVNQIVCWTGCFVKTADSQNCCKSKQRQARSNLQPRVLDVGKVTIESGELVERDHPAVVVVMLVEVLTASVGGQ